MEDFSLGEDAFSLRNKQVEGGKGKKASPLFNKVINPRSQVKGVKLGGGSKFSRITAPLVRRHSARLHPNSAESYEAMEAAGDVVNEAKETMKVERVQRKG